MKIAELFENLFLIEHLGNLDFIDKKFRHVLKVEHTYEYDRNLGRNNIKIHARLPKEIGRDSTTSTAHVNTIGNTVKLLVDDETAWGFVIKLGAEQVFFAMKVKSNKSSGKPDYVWAADQKLLLSKVNEPDLEPYQNILDNARVVDIDAGNDYWSGDEGELSNAISAFIKVMKLAKGLPLDITVFHIDEAKIKAKKDRIEARKFNYFDHQVKPPQTGRAERDPHHLSKVFHDAAVEAGIPDAEELTVLFRNIHRSDADEYKLKNALNDIRNHFQKAGKKNPFEFESVPDWEYFAKKALEIRLEKFKEDHAAEVSTPEEMIALLKEKGFLDKIRIQGLLYKPASSSIDFNSLRRGQGAWIEYDCHDTKKRDEIRVAVTEIAKELTDNETQQQKIINSQVPPYSYRVLLKLDKGAIVVDKMRETKFHEKVK